MHHRFHHFFGRHAGRHGFGVSRKLGSADLQVLILRLLDEKPSHGYEIIKALDEHSNGFYVPSPGMVYPALTYLEELGFATVEAVGARKQYHISAAGKEHLEKNRAAADALFAQFGRVGERMDRVRRALDAEDADEEPTADQERHGSRELHRARRDLKLALLDKWNSSREEQQRIAAILKRATAQILSQ